MASARAHVTPDYWSGRAAFGFRPQPGLPWFGPEIASDAGTLRYGAHATAIALPGGIGARVSAGGSSLGAYGELSLWRRF